MIRVRALGVKTEPGLQACIFYFLSMAKILIIDDEKSIRSTLREILEYEKYEVEEAEDGEIGLDLIKKNEYDAVLCDIKMPKLDGIEVLEKSHNVGKDTPFIMISAHGTIETAVEGMKIGAFDYILKPANFEELLDKITEAKKSKTAQEERIQKAESHALLMESRKGGKSPFPS